MKAAETPSVWMFLLLERDKQIQLGLLVLARLILVLIGAVLVEAFKGASQFIKQEPHDEEKEDSNLYCFPEKSHDISTLG